MNNKLDFKRDFDSINERIFNIIHLAINIIFVPLLLASISRVFSIGFNYIFVFHSVILGLVWALYFGRKKIKFKTRNISFILVMIALSIPSIPLNGLIGLAANSLIVFYIFLIVLFHGKKAAFLGIAFTVIYLLGEVFIYLPDFYENGWQDIVNSRDLANLIFFITLPITFSIVIVFSLDKYREYFKNNLKKVLKSSEKIKARELAFKKLSNLTFEGILIHDKGIAVDVNLSFLNMFGYEKDEIIGTNIITLIASEKYHKIISENVIKNYALPYEVEGIKKDGSIIPVELEARNIKSDDTNEIIRVVAIRNISYRKQAEQKLIKAKEQAEESDQLKTEFIKNMSHEIRTPLNGILGFSNILNKPNLPDEKKKYYITIIQNSGNQLLQIIEAILEISRLGTKQEKISESNIHINDLFSDLFSIFEIKAKEKGLVLNLIKGLSDKESSVLTDKAKLYKILSNLLDNALKFTTNGFIEFGYKLKTDIEPVLNEQSRGMEMEIYVKDTGIGIKAESQEIIFKRFSQEEKSLERNVGGLGLGLSIAKENAELLGGTITVKSEKGKGSTFFVTIPFKSEISKTEKGNSKIEKIGATEKPEKHTILIVEDEKINYIYLETLLENFKLNLIILHAEHGKIALEMCRENSEIDFVLMDMKMPIMNGFEATKLIKEFRPDLLIVAQTAYSTREEKGDALLSGCDDFISKPISEETLNEIINKYLIKK